MKRILSLPCVALLLISTTIVAQNRIIEQPDYESNNSMSFDISKLELDDSVTVLFCDAYQAPGNWILISSKSYLIGESGRKYKLLRSEGFELDKKVNMPPSGHVPFKLFMEPLEKEESFFDYIEGDGEGAFIITGISTFKLPPPDTDIHCLLKGEVVDRPQSIRLILTKENGDERVLAKYIPIRNGKFEYALNCDDEESYELTFLDERISNRGWRPVKFFSDSSIISFTLFPMDDYHKNIVEGGELNAAYRDYLYIKDSLLQIKAMEKQLKNLQDSDRYYSEAIRYIEKQIEITEDKTIKDSLQNLASKMYDSGEARTPEANEWTKIRNDLRANFNVWEMDFIRNNNSIMTFSLLMMRTYRSLMERTYGDPNISNDDILQCIDIYNSIYAEKYPYHPYSEMMNNMIESYYSIKVGGSFIDFTASDFEGNPVRLSEQIKGKIALIDLWASWCGPCRRSSISMIPIYEEYKDKGFTVIGVAREAELSSAVKTVNKDKYPWLNLIELKDEGKIWEKYGLGNSGGGTFLVDKDGTILAVHSNAEEVKKILDDLLK